MPSLTSIYPQGDAFRAGSSCADSQEPRVPAFPFSVRTILLQPTTLCNLNCRYCYLPFRKRAFYISVEVVERVVAYIKECGRRLTVAWHGGEPLACGVERFRSLMAPFDAPDIRSLVTHSLQTNASLITNEWCDLFRDFEVEIGVSIDGPSALNLSRRDWQGAPAFGAAMSGVETLQRNGLRFSMLAVVQKDSLPNAALLYAFAQSLGCWHLGLNVEETEGPHRARDLAREEVLSFWRELFRCWRLSPTIEVREFARGLFLLRELASDRASPFDSADFDLFPSIGVNGEVVLLSPELLDNAPEFVVGNVREEPLEKILSRGRASRYVEEYYRGVLNCKRVCQYYPVCGGGVASNRYFELGRLETTETRFCINHNQLLTDGILLGLQEG